MKNYEYKNDKERMEALRKDVVKRYNTYIKNHNNTMNFTKATVIVLLIQLVTEFMFEFNVREIRFYWIIRILLLINIAGLHIIESISFNIFKKSVDVYTYWMEKLGDDEVKVISRIVADVFKLK